MKKIILIVGAISALLSLCGIYICAIIEAIFPKAVRGLFDIFGGRYSPGNLELEFGMIYVLCTVVFVIGVATAVWAYLSSKKEKIL